MDWILLFGKELVNLTIEMAPYLMLGFLFAGILYAWFPDEKMVKYLGKNNSASVFNAAIMGVPLPLCSCGVIPTGISFYRNGASKGSAVAFLISTPQTGVDSIMVTWSLLGWPLAVLRPIIALITGMLGGILTNFTVNRDNKKNPPEQVVPVQTEKKKISLIEMLRYAFVDFLQDIVKWLTIGLLIAALMAVIIPEDFFLRYLSNDYLSMLLILLVSVPLYVCATGSVPIAAVLMMKGLSPGAALVFLMAGPATNAATISVIGSALGRKTMFTYLFSIISGALFFGILVNEFFPRDLFMNAMNHIHTGGHVHEILPHWLKIGSAIILTILMINGLLRIYLPSVFVKKTQIIDPIKYKVMKFKTISVEGMTCNHCKMTVENNLKKMSGVSDVKADLISGKVILEGENLNLLLVQKTITDLGYKYKGEV
jgi:uncharacterized membrane protein YraQ (UPF0718 family)/copper chaperone CopZ